MGMLNKSKTTARHTSFLIYSYEVVLPIELEIVSRRRLDTKQNAKLWNELIDYLPKFQDQVALRMAKYIRWMTMYYINGVWTQKFEIGDLVLRKIMSNTKVLVGGPLKSKLGRVLIIHDIIPSRD